MKIVFIEVVRLSVYKRNQTVKRPDNRETDTFAQTDQPKNSTLDRGFEGQLKIKVTRLGGGEIHLRLKKKQQQQPFVKLLLYLIRETI